MNGIFLIDKEVGFTSRDVVNIIGRHFHTKKVGHAGTLDPFATGPLIVTFNKGTKVTEYLESYTKTYLAELLLGNDTDTLDLEGNITETKEVPNLTEDQIKEVLNCFLGSYSQSVPKFSAVKFKGKELYKYARNNEDTPTLKRVIDIIDISLISYKKNIIKFEVTCSKGTYIRQLGQDIAHKLNTCGHLISLRRTQVGGFKVEDGVLVKEVKEDDIISIVDALKNYPSLIVDEKLELDIKNGKRVKLECNSDLLFIINKSNEPVAILEYLGNQEYKVKRGLF